MNWFEKKTCFRWSESVSITLLKPPSITLERCRNKRQRVRRMPAKIKVGMFSHASFTVLQGFESFLASHVDNLLAHHAISPWEGEIA